MALVPLSKSKHANLKLGAVDLTYFSDLPLIPVYGREITDLVCDYPLCFTIKDNNVEQAIRVLKRKLQKEGFFKVMKMKSTYEKPSERKKRVQTENLKRIKKLQKLKNRY